MKKQKRRIQENNVDLIIRDIGENPRIVIFPFRYNMPSLSRKWNMLETEMPTKTS